MNKMSLMVLVVLLSLTTACSEEEGPRVSFNNAGGGGPISMGGGTKKDMGADMGADMADMTDMDGDMAAPVFDAPIESDALFKFLQDKKYSTFAAESMMHPSSGPHGQVRTFVSDKITAAVVQGSAFPIGAATVKELFTSDGTLRGWAVSVKVNDEGGVEDWYWYENFSVTQNQPVADGTDETLCSGCHMAGQDMVLTTFPLQ